MYSCHPCATKLFGRREPAEAVQVSDVPWTPSWLLQHLRWYGVKDCEYKKSRLYGVARHAGSVVLKTYPFLDCEEVEGRYVMGVVGTVVFLAGIPMFIFGLLLMYHRRRFRTGSSYYLVRSIFSGHRSVGPSVSSQFINGRTFALNPLELQLRLAGTHL